MWIDTLSPYNPDETFRSLAYYFQIDSVMYLIARYQNLKVKDFLKIPQIDQVADSVAFEVSDKLLASEQIKTYLIIDRTPGDTTYFKFINSKLVVSLRIEVKL